MPGSCTACRAVCCRALISRSDSTWCPESAHGGRAQHERHSDGGIRVAIGAAGGISAQHLCLCPISARLRRLLPARRPRGSPLRDACTHQLPRTLACWVAGVHVKEVVPLVAPLRPCGAQHARAGVSRCRRWRAPALCRAQRSKQHAAAVRGMPLAVVRNSTGGHAVMTTKGRTRGAAIAARLSPHLQSHPL